MRDIWYVRRDLTLKRTQTRARSLLCTVRAYTRRPRIFLHIEFAVDSDDYFCNATRLSVWFVWPISSSCSLSSTINTTTTPQISNHNQKSWGIKSNNNNNNNTRLSNSDNNVVCIYMYTYATHSWRNVAQFILDSRLYSFTSAVFLSVVLFFVILVLKRINLYTIKGKLC